MNEGVGKTITDNRQLGALLRLTKRYAHHWPRFASAAMVALLVGGYFVFPEYQSFVDEAWGVLTSNDEQRIEKWVSQFGIWGPVLIMVMMTVQMFLIVVPSWLLMVVAVLAYGFIGGIILSIVAVTVASSVGYGIGRIFGEPTVERIVGRSNTEKIRRVVDRHGLTIVALIRFAPFLSNDAISFVAGVVEMRFLRFIAATVVGITPLMLLIGWLGEDWQRMKQGLIWSSVAVLSGYLAYLVWKYWLRHDE